MHILNTTATPLVGATVPCFMLVPDITVVKSWMNAGEQQMELLSRTTVLVTTVGSRSFRMAFLPDGAQVPTSSHAAFSTLQKKKILCDPNKFGFLGLSPWDNTKKIF